MQSDDANTRDSKLPHRYEPQKVEQKVYDYWMQGGFFAAKVDESKEPYTIVMPPPNVTGDLHLGHALDNTLQDVLIRRARMQGYEALWQPGTDHAGIATQHVVEKRLLQEEGISRRDMSRQDFVDEVWSWKDELEESIISTLQRMGASADWSRKRFTLDEGLSRAVQEVFVQLYEKGMIYRGDYLINWCPGCSTALSDIEVEHKDESGRLYHIEYPVLDSDGETVTVATTRPETMLGDTALAIYPDDERFAHLVGKTAVVPLVNREVPIIADHQVDPEFGTGAVKVTPAHDPDDFEMGLRADLPQVQVIGSDGNMTENAPDEYSGLPYSECRELVVGHLQQKGYLKKIEDHQHAVGHCYRCETGIQPLISRQWFVRMDELAEPAVQAVLDGRIRFIPERFNRVYLNWMDNIRDWCISRQLWWGHRIPAWYCQECDEVIVARQKPQMCPECCSDSLRQETDVLDTWFSSALWPFSTQGWPEETPEMEYFYPTDVLVTGWDIIPFWVARMIFSALEFTDDIPFSDVLIHGLVLDPQGRKMSKSLGNGVHPLEVVEEYGADALRFCMLFGNTPGNDMRFFWERAEAGRNFANKLWNACRFAIMHLPDDYQPAAVADLTLRPEDKWLLTRLAETIDAVDEYMHKYQLGEALKEIYEFSWSELCDWYIEMSKPRLSGDKKQDAEAARTVLLVGLRTVLKLLHPFMPFVTEELWDALPGEDSALITARWPQSDQLPRSQEASDRVTLWMAVIRCARNLRAEVNVSPAEQVQLSIIADAADREKLREARRHFSELAGVKELHLMDASSSPPEKALVDVVGNMRVALPLEGVVDLQQERQRLEKKLEDSLRMLQRSRNKLNNEQFVTKAPDEVVEQEKERLQDAKDQVENLRSRIKQISG